MLDAVCWLAHHTNNDKQEMAPFLFIYGKNTKGTVSCKHFRILISPIWIALRNHLEVGEIMIQWHFGRIKIFFSGVLKLVKYLYDVTDYINAVSFGVEKKLDGWGNQPPYFKNYEKTEVEWQYFRWKGRVLRLGFLVCLLIFMGKRNWVHVLGDGGCS